MPNRASGTIGMYRITRSPLPTPSPASTAASVDTASRNSRYVMLRFVPVTGES